MHLASLAKATNATNATTRRGDLIIEPLFLDTSSQPEGNRPTGGIVFLTAIPTTTLEHVVAYIAGFTDIDRTARRFPGMDKDTLMMDVVDTEEMEQNEQNERHIAEKIGKWKHAYLRRYVSPTIPPPFTNTIPNDIAFIKRILWNSGYTRRLVHIPWKFCILNDHIENNLPHTHDDVIFLPKGFVNMSPTARRTTLLHEQLHIFQRFHPIPTQRLYIDIWKLFVVGITSSKEFSSRLHRSNPDVDRLVYTHYDPTRNAHVHTHLVFASKTPTDLLDTTIKVDVVKRLKPIDMDMSMDMDMDMDMDMKLPSEPFSKPLSSPPHLPTSTTEFALSKSPDYYEIIHNPIFNIKQTEHPNEVMACLIPKILLSPKIRHTPTEQWMQQHL
jgi:hypothetical protein